MGKIARLYDGNLASLIELLLNRLLKEEKE